MLYANENGLICYKDEVANYDFSNADDYRKFILLITDPRKECSLKPDLFCLDEELEEGTDEFNTAERYKEFFGSFLNTREGYFES